MHDDVSVCISYTHLKIMMFFMGIFKLGRLLNYMSHSVLCGFTTVSNPIIVDPTTTTTTTITTTTYYYYYYYHRISTTFTIAVPAAATSDASHGGHTFLS